MFRKQNPPLVVASTTTNNLSFHIMNYGRKYERTLHGVWSLSGR